MIAALNGCVLIDGNLLEPYDAAILGLTVVHEQPLFAKLVARACQRAEAQRAEIRRAVHEHGRELVASDHDRDEREPDALD